MAVTPTRALLTAYFQTSLARSTKELSKQGVWALVLLVVILGFLVAVPVGLGMGLGGYALGTQLKGPQSDRVAFLLGALLALVTVIGGVMGGLLGGAKKLSWEQYRLFPLRRSELFTAELVAGLGDVLVMGLALALLALCLGLGIAQPTLLPFLPLVFLLHLGLLLALQLFLGSLAQRLAKRLKLMVGLLMGAVWAGSIWMSSLTPRKGELPDPALQARLRGIADGAVRTFEWLPTTASARGLAAWLEGHWVIAFLRQLYPLALFLLLAWGASFLLEREQEALAPAPEKGKARLWSFRSPVEGLARLQLRTLLSSHHGKFGFVMPVMTVVLLRGPMSHFGRQAAWALPGAFAYLALFGNQFQFNQFGLDGHGVKGIFLLPLGGRQILAGKLGGFAAYQGLQALLLMVLMIPLFHPPLPEVLAALALAACFFLAQSMVGSFTSSWMPRRIDRASLKNNQMPLPLVLVSLGVSFGSSALFGGTFALLKWLAPAFLLPGMLALAALCWGLHRLLAPGAAAYLERRRETIVEAMG